ncbi:hypothetical protein [Ramlibacter rhizophilus]|uniref:Uncharacterized protein n=1 Tax=Ramlibacter rhizophilus TaxID=1781167 RepID=A0A4Z0C0Q2_9BURK|nr:hypothetical protein [Ramlibacter rhizophilus]TFZ04791.1 hypothetical protein EZ242_03305 [Ramlibacter rhizophilus]
MNLTDQLRQWGLVHAQTRQAEQILAGATPADASEALADRARQLRLAADQLHRDIYGRIGARNERPGS